MKIELSGHFSRQRIIKSVIPSMLMFIVISVYSVVDGLFISNYTGTSAFAAVNLIMPVLMGTGALGMMMGTGGNALVSKTLGEGDIQKAQRIFSMIIKFTFLLGIVFTILILIFIRPISLFLGADDSMVDICVSYGRILALGLTPFMIQCAFQALFMTAEIPQVGTVLSIVTGLANIALDALLVAGMKLGVEGAALATIGSQFLGGIYPLLYFKSRKNKTNLKLISSQFVWREIGEICVNGSSEFVANVAISVVSMCYNFMLITHIGEYGVAAYGVMMYTVYIFVAIIQGYNVGIAPIVGFNYGAQNKSELKSLLIKSIELLSMIGLGLLIVCQIFARPMALIFVSYDPELVDFTTRAFRLYTSAILLCGFTYFAGSFFTALSNGIVSAIISFTRTFIFELVSVFCIPLLFGIEWIWISWAVSEVLALCLSAFLIWKYRHRYGYL